MSFDNAAQYEMDAHSSDLEMLPRRLCLKRSVYITAVCNHQCLESTFKLRSAVACTAHVILFTEWMLDAMLITA